MTNKGYVGTPALDNETVKGVFRSIGDAGDSPSDSTGETLLKKIDRLLTDIVLASFSSATSTKVSVGTTSTTVLSANPNRRLAVFVNDSDTEIYLSLSSTAVLNEGIRLNANGGLYEINLMNLYTGEVSAISSADSKNLTVTEG